MQEDFNLDNPIDLSSGPMPMDKYQMPNHTIEAKSVDELAPRPENERKGPNATGCFSWEYWQLYFDIDQFELKSRITASLNPMNPIFQTLIEEKPDLYGPFWLATMLVFLLSVSGNFANLLWFMLIHSHTKDEPQDNLYDFQNIGSAVCVIYGSLIFFPLIYKAINHVLGCKVSLLYVVCNYGYSYTIFVISGVLCIIPITFLRWVFMLLACAHSIGF